MLYLDKRTDQFNGDIIPFATLIRLLDRQHEESRAFVCSVVSFDTGFFCLIALPSTLQGRCILAACRTCSWQSGFSNSWAIFWRCRIWCSRCAGRTPNQILFELADKLDTLKVQLSKDGKGHFNPDVSPEAFRFVQGSQINSLGNLSAALRVVSTDMIFLLRVKVIKQTGPP